MIQTLLLTILVEGLVVCGYSLRFKKPLLSILATSVFANLLTQSLLWLALKIFFQNYLLTLFSAEILIWLIESVMLYGFRPNQLSLKESFFLSLIMNLSSFILGWLLPV